jgi:hypothetical protein
VWGLNKPITHKQLTQIVSDAHVAASGEYNIRAAQQWAQGYDFQAELIQTGLLEFKKAGSLEALCIERHASLAPRRLNLNTVHLTFGENGDKIPGLHPTDFKHLCTLAIEGIELLLPADFESTSTPPALRKKDEKVAPAVHKIMASQVEQGTMLILPMAEVAKIPGVHFSCQHWTENKGKPQGRILCDVANAEAEDGTPLNGKGMLEKQLLRTRIKEKWDEIKHPTLMALMQMALDVADEYGWDNSILWKMDLAGAFNLLWFNPSATKYLAFPLTNDRAAIHLAGMFGWVGMPFVFQVVTRAVLALCAVLVLGVCLIYVDDFMGASPEHKVAEDVDAVHRGVTSLLGPDSIAVKKNESGRELDWLGWQVNLNVRSVTISERNLLKTLHAFFDFDLTNRPKNKSNAWRH